MKMKVYLFHLCLCFLIACSSKDTSQQAVQEDGWQVLFNGKDLSGWIPKLHHHEVGENYANTFRVVDGAIQVNYSDYTTFDERYGHLFYEKPFSSFHLKFEYRFTDQWLDDAPSYTYRNSGIMFHSQAPETILKEQDWPISVEYQMLAKVDPDKRRPTGNVCTPGTEVFFDGDMTPDHCVNSSSDTYPWDAWVKGELIVHRDSLVLHLVNGDTVLRYTNPQIGGGVAERYDPAIKVDGKPLTKGYIGLQAEGQGVAFKNLMIREL